MQAELAMLQTQLMNSRFAYASALQTTQLQQPNMNTGALQPAYSNNSCASTNLLNLSTFNNNPSFVLEMDTAPSSSLEPLQLTRLSQCKEEDEEENKTQKAFNRMCKHDFDFYVPFYVLISFIPFIFFSFCGRQGCFPLLLRIPQLR